jgi:hypothetical protein
MQIIHFIFFRTSYHILSHFNSRLNFINIRFKNRAIIKLDLNWVVGDFSALSKNKSLIRFLSRQFRRFYCLLHQDALKVYKPTQPQNKNHIN